MAGFWPEHRHYATGGHKLLKIQQTPGQVGLVGFGVGWGVGMRLCMRRVGCWARVYVAGGGC